MTVKQCLLCESEEGIFLDLKDQPTLVTKAINCRLPKVSINTSSTKICHKCAFEIDKCNDFVDKVKSFHKSSKLNERCCGLCADPHTQEKFFDLTQCQTAVDDLLKEVNGLFSLDEVKIDNLHDNLICLTCRYSIDLFNNLRRFSDTNSIKSKTTEDGIISVNNKISAIEDITDTQPSNLNLHTPSDTESDSSIIMSKKKLNKALSLSASQLLKKCTKCKTTSETCSQMYRVFKTKLTYCNNCWLTLDHVKNPKKRKKIVYPETKLCSVLVQDLFEVNSEIEKEFVIEKNEDGNSVFKATYFTKNKNKNLKKNSLKNDKAENSCVNEIQDITKNKKNISISESKSTKSSRNIKDSENEKIEDTKITSSRTRRRKDSELSNQSEVQTRPTRSTRNRKDSEQSVKDEESIVTSKRSTRTRKISEQSLDDVSGQSTRTTRKRKDSELSVQEEDEIIDVDADSDTGPILKKLKTTNAKTKSMPKETLKSKQNNQNSAIENRTKRKRERSSSVESTSSSIRKSSRNVKKTLPELEEIIEVEDDSEAATIQKENDSDIEEVAPLKKKKIISDNEQSEIESEKNKLSEESSALKLKNSLLTNDVKMTESESEEIDILKSTDDDTKTEDNFETELEKKDTSNLNEELSENENDSKDDNVSNDIVSKDENSTIKHVTETVENVSSKEVTPEPTEKIDEPFENLEEVKDDTSVDMREASAEKDEGKNPESVSKTSSSRRSSLNSLESRKIKGKGKRKSKKQDKVDESNVLNEISDSEVMKNDKVISSSYACRICDKLYDTKYLGMKHELTHMKNLEIKLSKVKTPEKIKVNDSNEYQESSNLNENDEKMFVEEEKETINEPGNIKDQNQETIDENEEIENLQNVECDNEKNVNQELSVDCENEKVSDELSVNDSSKSNLAEESDTNDTEEVIMEKSNKQSKSRRTPKRSPRKSPRKSEETTPKKPERISPRKSEEKTKTPEEKSPRKSRRVTFMKNDTESHTEEVPLEHNSSSEKIAEADSNTVEDVEELVEKRQPVEDSVRDDETSKLSDEENEIAETVTQDDEEIEMPHSTAEEENEVNSKENSEDEKEEEAQVIEDGDSEVSDTNNEISNENQEQNECETIDSPEEEEITATVIDDDDEVSKDVDDASKQAEESEIEITEVEDTDVYNIPETECAEIDLTENEDCDVSKTDDVVEIEEVIDSNEAEVIDSNEAEVIEENNDDCISEINITSTESAHIENDAGNPKQDDSLESMNDETTDNTEDELAQATLEELMQRKGLHVVDEIRESVTEDDESEKEPIENSTCNDVNKSNLNITAGSEFQLKMSESEGTEALNDSDQSKQNEDDDGVVGECQIIQDVDVVEEVVNSDENAGEVEEIETENNVPFKFPPLY